ncbi:MAG: hypothetical protein CYPHOPRED_000478 [Cyphobasidiales sp. Tagirdzhanova-0007]|nr:MAG: hypothetical protein CYPHOPRED_000478 [Cyphobasidiales sp. Tagirdzhanova-0007]
MAAPSKLRSPRAEVSSAASSSRVRPSSPFRKGLENFPAMGPLVEEGKDPAFDGSWLPANNPGPSWAAADRRLDTTDELADFFSHGSLSDPFPGNKGKSPTGDLNVPIQRLDELIKKLQSSTTAADPELVRQKLADIVKDAKAAVLSSPRQTHATVSRSPNDDFQSPHFESTARHYLAPQSQSDFTDHALFMPSNEETASPRHTVHLSGTVSASSTPLFRTRDNFRGRAVSSSLVESIKTLSNTKALLRQERAERMARQVSQSFSGKFAQWKAAEEERRILQETRAFRGRLELQKSEDEREIRKAEEEKSLRHFHERQAAEAAQLKAVLEANEKAKVDKEAAAQAKKDAEAVSIKQAQEAILAGTSNQFDHVRSYKRPSEADSQSIYSYFLYLAQGGERVPQYDELLRTFYAAGRTDVALTQHLENLHAAAHRHATTGVEARQHERPVADEARFEGTIQHQSWRTPNSVAEPLDIPSTVPGSQGRSPEPSIGTETPQSAQTGDCASLSQAQINNSLHEAFNGVLRHVCDNEEYDRQAALEQILDLNGAQDKLRLIDVSMDPSPDLQRAVNSAKQMIVSIFPLPNPRHSKFHEILAAQLTAAVAHLRRAAIHYSAQYVTQLRFHESQNPCSVDMGRISALLVQSKSLESDGSTDTPGTLSRDPFRKYERHAVPEGILKKPAEFELLIESA